MSTKVEKLVEWCQTQNAIPASCTPERNDLCDLVMQRTDAEIVAFYGQIKDDQRAVRTWVWLVTTVCDMDTAIRLLRMTLIRKLWHDELTKHEQEIAAGWNEVHTAKLNIASQLREIDTRELRMAATVNDLKVAQDQLGAAYREIRDLRDEVAEMSEIKAAHDVMVQSMWRGHWQHKPLTEQSILDKYREAVSCMRDLECNYPADELCKQPRFVIDDALEVFRQTGMSPADLAELAYGWSVDRPHSEEESDV